jgi:hypothetical protein
MHREAYHVDVPLCVHLVSWEKENKGKKGSNFRDHGVIKNNQF